MHRATRHFIFNANSKKKTASIPAEIIINRGIKSRKIITNLGSMLKFEKKAAGQKGPLMCRLLN